MIGILYTSYDKASLIAPITEDIPQDSVIDTICGQIVSNYDNPACAINKIVTWETVKK